MTIQCTILPRLIEFKEVLSDLEMMILVSIFLISLLFYLGPLLIFMSTLNNIDKIGTVPRIDWYSEPHINHVTKTKKESIISEILGDNY